MRILVAGIGSLDKSKFNKISKTPVGDWQISAEGLNKPNGGLWGSTLITNGEYPSDWIRWVISEEFNINKYCNKRAISFTLKKKAKICTIASVDDYKAIMKKYSKPKYKDNDCNEKVIDWVKLAKDYDAFHLTEDAFCKMRLPLYSIIDDEGCELSDFYSYDCESWVLLNLDYINEGSILNHSLKKYMEYDN